MFVACVCCGSKLVFSTTSSHSIDVMVARETKLRRLQGFSSLLNDYEKVMSCEVGRNRIVVLIRKKQGLAETIFVDPGGEWVALNLTEKKSFKLIGVSFEA